MQYQEILKMETRSIKAKSARASVARRNKESLSHLVFPLLHESEGRCVL